MSVCVCVLPFGSMVTHRYNEELYPSRLRCHLSPLRAAHSAVSCEVVDMMGWFILRQSKMTMTSLDGWPLVVGPEVAGESNPGSEGPPACGTHVGGC